MTKEQSAQVIETVKKALFESSIVLANDLELMLLDTVTPIKRSALVEEHLMSPQMLEGRARH